MQVEIFIEKEINNLGNKDYAIIGRYDLECPPLVNDEIEYPSSSKKILTVKERRHVVYNNNNIDILKIICTESLCHS